MSSRWASAALVAQSDITQLDSGTVTLDSGRRFAELPESGWGALLGWLAGGERLIRCDDDPGRYGTRVAVHRAETESVEVRVRSDAEQSIVDEDINAYLTDAGAEPRPSGFRWFILLPDDTTADELWSAANEAAATADPHPSALLQPVGNTLTRLYDR